MELAKTLGVTQSLISKWETSGQIPPGRRDEISQIFGVSVVDQEDSVLCGSSDDAAKWRDFFHAFNAQVIDGANDSLSEHVDVWGVSTVLGPLVNAGFVLPSPPVAVFLDDLNFDNHPITYQDAGIEYFFGSSGPLEEFFWMEYFFSSALADIRMVKEICPDDYGDFGEKDICGYVWFKVFEKFPLKDYPIDRCADFVKRFNTGFLDVLRETAKSFENKVYRAWTNAYRSNSLNVHTPTWLPHGLLESVHGESYGKVVFSEHHLRQGLSPDPFIRQIQKTLRCPQNAAAINGEN